MRDDICGPAYRLTQIRIIEAIKKMRPGKNRLPPEDELAKLLGVSRSTVREAMHRLVIEGIVTKRQGKGNFGHPAVARLPYRLDRNLDMIERLSDKGRDLTFCVQRPDLRNPSSRFLNRVPEMEEQKVFHWEVEYRLDGELALMASLEIPEPFFRGLPEVEEPAPLRYFLKLCTNRDPAYFISWIIAEARPEIRERYQWGCDVMQNWEELFYDLHDIPFCFTELFFNPGLIEVSMVVTL